MTLAAPAPALPGGLVDVRGPRFAAWVTTVVLATVLLLAGSPTLAGLLLAGQAVVFALGATDLRRSPYGVLFRVLLAPRLGPPPELEDRRPPQFAQAVGLAFAATGALAFLTGAGTLGVVATAAALAAAFLNAAFGFCLGCQVYLLLARARART